MVEVVRERGCRRGIGLKRMIRDWCSMHIRSMRSGDGVHDSGAGSMHA